MATSSRLPLPVIRAVFDVVGECCELGADPAGWRTHLLGSMTRLLHCKVGLGGRADLNPEIDRESLLRSLGDVGWATAAERRSYFHWISTGRAEENPISARIAETRIEHITGLRREFVDDGAWYRAPLVQAMQETAFVDDAVCSYSHLDRGRFLLLVGMRESRDHRFSARDRDTLALLASEVRRHLGRRLEAFDAPGVLELPPRLRTVLHCLLAGDSEKQVALRMGISTHTAHEHVKRLHRHFVVSSRGELLARCRRFWPVLERMSPESVLKECDGE